MKTQLKLLVAAQLPSIVPAAAAAGDVEVLCNHLDAKPQDVHNDILYFFQAILMRMYLGQ